MAGRDIVTNLIGNNRLSKPLKEAAKDASATADAVEELSVAERRLALEVEKASVRVEKATRSQTQVIQRYGEESDQARDATLRLKSAELDLADASEKLKRKAGAAGDTAEHAAGQFDKAGDAAERTHRRLDGLRDRLGMLQGFLGKAVNGIGSFTGGLKGLHAGLAGLPFVGAAAGAAAFGSAAITAAPAVIGMSTKVAGLLGHLARIGPAVAPAAASLLPLAAGLVLIKGTLAATGPAFTKALSPIGKAFTDVEGPVGHLATKHLPALSREFVRVNFPAIRSGMEYIAQSINGIVVSVGKWINSTTGQKAIAATVDNISEAFAALAPDVSKLAIAFLNLFGRTAGDTRAVDLLATALNRAIVGATNFLNSLTTEKIDAAWAAIDHYRSAIGDFIGRIAGWGAQAMQVVHWWKEHADAIQHVRDVLAVVSIVVGVATGGWIPALIAGVSLLVAHWDKVTGAVSGAVSWFKRAAGEGGSLKPVLDGINGVVADLSSWFHDKLIPALKKAGEDLMPTLRQAAQDVGKAFADHKDVIDKVRGIFDALGIILTEAVIPGLVVIAKVAIPLITTAFSGLLTVLDKVVLPGIRIFAGLVLGQISSVLHGAALVAEAFGLPIADKLREAAGKFDKFRDQVNTALNGINDQQVTVAATINYSTGKGTASGGKKVGQMARGGLVSGPGGPRDDQVPSMLSNREFVVNAKDTAEHRPLLEAINSGRMRGYANGGLVMSTSTSGIPQMMAAERKSLAAAAKQYAPSITVAGGNVQQWAPLVLRALALLGQPSSALGAVLSRMQRESGGNPHAINLTDINAQRGDPSRGLMQTIGGTFNAYSGPFKGRGIYDPMANIYAGLNYAIHRYGAGWVHRMGMPGGYDRGGLARGPGWMRKDTPAPERVLSPAQTVRFERAMNSAAGGTVVVNVSNTFSAPHYVGDRRDLVNALVKAQQSGETDVFTRKIVDQVQAQMRR